MEKNKHYIKVFITDSDTGFVCNFDGKLTQIVTSKDQLCMAIGYDIHCDKMNKIIGEQSEAVYGFRIDYTLTPLRTDPFK